jgi:hypothetical protein
MGFMQVQYFPTFSVIITVLTSKPRMDPKNRNKILMIWEETRKPFSMKHDTPLNPNNMLPILQVQQNLQNFVSLTGTPFGIKMSLYQLTHSLHGAGYYLKSR